MHEVQHLVYSRGAVVIVRQLAQLVRNSLYGVQPNCGVPPHPRGHAELAVHAPLPPEKERILGSLQSRSKDSHSTQRERVTDARKFPQHVIPQTHTMDVTLAALVYTGCHDDILHTHQEV